MALARYKGRPGRRCWRRAFPAFTYSGPRIIYPVESRKEPNLSYRVCAIYPALRVLFPNQVIPADKLGRAMVGFAVGEAGEPGGQILENRDIRAMVKSPRPPNRGAQAGLG
jgi:hypothetical protein